MFNFWKLQDNVAGLATLVCIIRNQEDPGHAPDIGQIVVKSSLCMGNSDLDQHIHWSVGPTKCWKTGKKGKK